MIGRYEEQKILLKSLHSKQSEFIAVVGRRRVGKTHLIEEFFKDQMAFHISGQKDFTNQQHLKIFTLKLKAQFPKAKFPQPCDNWLNLMLNLIHCLKSKSSKKRVVFFDELPWLSKPKSNFLAALGYFWNEWARKNNVILVVCGSAASWMLSNIVREKGSLYNRMTKLINVQPFTIQETKAFFESNNIRFTTEQLIQIYMVMGGIPHYLKEVEKGASAIQNIQRICFSPNGLLVKEYGNLYDALFTNSQDHKKIIEVLFKSKKGLTKLEISKASKLLPNGAFYDKIEELVECGFIMEVHDITEKSKHNLYRLIDEYSLFYHHFIKNNKSATKTLWHSIANTSKYHAWSGYAFENLCFRHIQKIKTALQIGGMVTKAGSFYARSKAGVAGAQIDMIIDRADQCLNIIECKFFKDDFYLTKNEAEKIKKRKATFQYHSATKKQIYITTISPGQLIFSKASIGLIDQAFNTDIFLD